VLLQGDEQHAQLLQMLLLFTTCEQFRHKTYLLGKVKVSDLSSEPVFPIKTI